MKLLIVSWIIFLYTVFFAYSILAGCAEDLNFRDIKKINTEIKQIYKHDEVLYIRLSKEEKKEIKKKLYKDNSLEIYLK